MGCETVRMPDGGTMTMCSRGRQPRLRCRICGHIAPYLCDYPTTPGRTCDIPLCGVHTAAMGSQDYCPLHAEQRQPSLWGSR